VWFKQNEQTYLEDLKAGNIENTNEVLLLVFGVDGLVNASDEPVEHSYVDGFCQRRHRVYHLCKIVNCPPVIALHSRSNMAGCRNV